uniref:MGMT family protein n=1 Tax=Geoglobus ahangari TaxID=113653 RepID=A0A7C3YNM8_9EURY
MLERIIVKWDPSFVLEVEKGTVKRAYFGNEGDEIITTDFSKKLKKELRKYFKGTTTDFEWVNVEYPKSSERILKEVRKIPFGKTVTYGDLAKRLRTSPRAVGVALRMNRIPVIIPCHRVVAKRGLGGYSYGIEIKRKLLSLENP